MRSRNVGKTFKYDPKWVTIYSLQSNYNRTNDVCVRVCVWQPTPKTADVTVTKIAGYVRVRIHESVIFLVFLAFIVFMLQPLC